jgi:hypothetical protein
MKSLFRVSSLTSLAVSGALLIACTSQKLVAQQPFANLQQGLSQQLFATNPLPLGEIDGGLAFAANGDLWADSCNRNRLFRFDAANTVLLNGSSVHPQTAGSPIPSGAGCGLTNHPDGTLYSNTGGGLLNIDAATGAQLRPVFGPAGNGLGIAVDPQTGNLVYVGGAGGCFGIPPCTLISANPRTTTFSTFAQLDPADATFIDGIAFDPAGNFLFMAVRQPDRGLTVVNRNGAVVQHISMNKFPDGISFHTSPDYVVSNNNNGTISRFDFPGNDFTATPTESLLASGGFRGDLSQVGPDGCLYATQAATRFGDGTLSADNSVVRICPGFVPPPGVGQSAFVIGDRNADVGNQVTFWDAQWAKQNSLSGGPAPAAFKGFAQSAPQGCGGTWSSSPGNSSNPPETIPGFITVIVSSSIQSAGDRISGDIAKVVIVRADPGFGPAPGHTGTGVVVGVICGN